MASSRSDDEARRLLPLGLVGRARSGFLPTPSQSARGASGLPPLGLAGRPAAQHSFVIGLNGFEPKRRQTVVPVRRVGLTRPRRPPQSAHESGPSNWTGSASGSGGSSPSNYVGLSLAGLGGVGFGGGGGISFGGGSGSTFGNSSGRAFGNSSVGASGASSGSALGNTSGSFGSTSGVPFGITSGVAFESSSNIFSNNSSTTFVPDDVSLQFDNADEYAPSQQHVNAPPRRVIDLSKL